MRRILLALLLMLPARAVASINMSNGIVNISPTATDLTANWTVSAWVIYTASPAAIPTVLYGRANTFADSQFGIGTHNNWFEVWSEGTFLTIAEVGANGSIWYNVVVTRSGNVWTVYLNGTQVKQTTQAIAQASGTAFSIGGAPDGSGLAQGGALAVSEVAGWSSVLSTDLITALAHGTRISQFPVKPVYYWPNYRGGLNGFVIPDMSGNGWHGSVELIGTTDPLLSNEPGDCPCGMLYQH